jgi:hypothetical protein
MAATRLRHDRVSTCRLYRFSGSIRSCDTAVLLFDVGSSSLADDRALVAGRPRISAFGHCNRHDLDSLRATKMVSSPRVTPAQTSSPHLLAAFARGGRPPLHPNNTCKNGAFFSRPHCQEASRRLTCALFVHNSCATFCSLESNLALTVRLCGLSPRGSPPVRYERRTRSVGFDQRALRRKHNNHR